MAKYEKELPKAKEERDKIQESLNDIIANKTRLIQELINLKAREKKNEEDKKMLRIN